ncbi:MAG: dTMP kinase [Pseudomonadota bacterium]|nr:dTMP kinase [Pseudomonadota bacterium]
MTPSGTTKGRFITLEGGEGAGKSTQVEQLCEALRGRGLEVVATREPGGSDGAEAIRALLVTGDTARWDPLTEALLNFAARRDHYTRTIAPTLASGAWIVCDRFADSTMAYQGYGLDVDRDILRQLYKTVLGDFAPDLTIVLDLPVDVGLGRANRRGGDDRYERMDIEFHQRLRDGFLEIAANEPERCAVVDAEADMATVAAAVLALVIGHLDSDNG